MWVKNKNRQFCLFKWKYVQQTTRAKNHVEINNLIKLLNDVLYILLYGTENVIGIIYCY